jgi:hypothetical protein
VYVTQKYGDKKVSVIESAHSVQIEIFGGIERGELLEAMRLILEAEKVSSIIKWGAQDAL